jgi:hypothetical protein
MFRLCRVSERLNDRTLLGCLGPGFIRREILVRTGNTGGTKEAQLVAVGRLDGDGSNTVPFLDRVVQASLLPFLDDPR